LRAVVALIGGMLLAAGGFVGYLIGSRGEPEAATVTVDTSVPPGLPQSVERTRAAVVAAAERRDWDALRGLLAPGFKYTFGGPVEGGANSYWQRLEREGADDPLAVLTQALRLPYTLSRGTYVWPFAYDRTAEELTDYERKLLEPLGRAGVFSEGYLGWRAGIAPDGAWLFYLAGD
jgi:hypothetical protein